MNYWLLKTEPGDYSYFDLEEDQRAVWEGVRNNQALVFLRKIKKGDQVMIIAGDDLRFAGKGHKQGKSMLLNNFILIHYERDDNDLLPSVCQGTWLDQGKVTDILCKHFSLK